MTNNYAGRCSACDEWVEAGDGMVDKIDDEWVTRCSSCGVDAPAIAIVMKGAEALVKPQGFLGPDMFDAYKAACEDAGTRYSKASGGNLCPFGSIARVIEQLDKRGFDCIVEDDVAEAMREHVAGARETIADAGDRLDRVNELLAESGRELFGYQGDGVKWLASRKGGLLADEMGLGKTVQALVALDDAPRVLVICPAIAKGVWQREVAKWRPDITTVTVLKGRKSFRWPEAGEMVITNYDILPDIVGEESDTAWRKRVADATPAGVVIVADEAHALKNNKALRTKRFRSLSAMAHKADGKVWLLTATPIMSRPQELWGILMAAGLHTEAFSNWGTFADLMGGEKGRWGGYEWGKPSALVAERLQRVCLRRERADVLPDLPGKVWANLTVKITKAARKAADVAMAALEAAGIDLAAATEAAELAAMRGIAFDEMSAARAALATAKIPHMLKIVQAHEDVDEPLVVFSAHRAPIDILSERDGWAVITGDVSPAKRTQIEDDFQAGKLKGVAATIAAGGTAITLTHASQMLFVDRAWTPAENAQAEDRCCRIGQNDTVNITAIVADHPLDQNVAELLTGKAALIGATIEKSRRIEVAPVIDELEAASAIVASRASAPAPAPVVSAPVVAPAPAEQPEAAERRAAASAREEWAQAALIYLSRLDEGFDRQNAATGDALARQVVSAGLTDVQWSSAVRIAKAHWRTVGVSPGA